MSRHQPFLAHLFWIELPLSENRRWYTFSRFTPFPGPGRTVYDKLLALLYKMKAQASHEMRNVAFCVMKGLYLCLQMLQFRSTLSTLIFRPTGNFMLC